MNCQLLTIYVHKGRQFLWLGACVAILGACASPPDLTAFGRVASQRVDLTGSWVRNEEASDTALPQVQLEADLAANQPSGRRRPTPQQRAKIKTQGLAVLLDGLYLNATKIRVTQAPTALFVKFDLARVNEYRFGEKRDSNVGPISVLLTSGWEADRYAVKSITDDRTTINDYYFLSQDGLRLHREVHIAGKEISERIVIQVFDRIP